MHGTLISNAKRSVPSLPHLVETRLLTIIWIFFFEKVSIIGQANPKISPIMTTCSSRENLLENKKKVNKIKGVYNILKEAMIPKERPT